MNAVDIVLLLFGVGTCARGVHSVVAAGIVDEGERVVGAAATRHGIILIVLGLGIASHALFKWSWVTALVRWRQSWD